MHIFNIIKLAITSTILLSNQFSSFLHYKSNKNPFYILSNQQKNFMMDDKYSKLFDDKKIITISPGGVKGFYLLGILTYIKETYNTDDFIYSGASAGAWNGLFMCYKGDPLYFAYNLLDSDIKKAKSINEIEYFMKYKILANYKTEDFDFSKLFIGVTTFKGLKPNIHIFSDFQTLEDAINCCIASSHIPILTGGLTNKYHNMFAFDGGFSSYPYVNRTRILHISPSMWSKIDTNRNIVKIGLRSVKQFYEVFSLYKTSFIELYDDGYHDAKKNRAFLDTIFTPKFE